ncbi:ANK1, partial [Symbiodinium microadriaticum]
MTLNPKTCNSDPETSSTPERILPHLCFEAGSETEGVLAALAAGHVEVVRLQYEFKADEHLGESCQEVLLLLLAKASAESEEKGPDKVVPLSCTGAVEARNVPGGPSISE